MDEKAPSPSEPFLVRLCANAVLASALLPYVSPIPISSMDVQLAPFAISLLSLAGVVAFTRIPLTVTRSDILIFGLGLLSLVYVNPGLGSVSAVDWLRDCAPILLSFPMYFAVRNLYRWMSPSVSVWVVSLYFAVLLIQIILPQIYMAVFPHFLSDVRWAPEEGRGPNGLCPEPSMMGNLCVLFAILPLILHRDFWHTHGRARWTIIAMAAAMLVLTRSGTGIIVALVTLGAAIFSVRRSPFAKAGILAAIALLTVGVGRLLTGSNSRGAQITSMLAANPANLIQEPSVGERLVGIADGLYQTAFHPLGTGDTRLHPELTEKLFNTDFAALIWPNPEVREFIVALEQQEENRGVGALIQRMGLPGILVLVLLIREVRSVPGTWILRVFVFTLFFNATLFISTLWLVIGCAVAIRQECQNPIFRFSLFSEPDLLYQSTVWPQKKGKEAQCL
jgi:hypothetical protein